MAVVFEKTKMLRDVPPFPGCSHNSAPSFFTMKERGLKLVYSGTFSMPFFWM